MGRGSAKNTDGKSELESSVDVYRTKQDRVRFLEIGTGIATGLLKGLPAVIVANAAIVFVLSVGSYHLSVDEHYIRDVGITSLLTLLTIYTWMAWLDCILVPRLTRNTDHSNDELALVNALRKITAAGFKSYIAHLPTIRPEKLHWGNLDDVGALDRGRHNLEWRNVSEISPSVQLNMKYMSGSLVQTMDELSKACVIFADSFDKYSLAFKNASSRWDKRKQGESAATTLHMKSAIIGSYLFFSESVPDEIVLGRVRSEWSLNSETETFLREFLRGDSTNESDVSSLRTRKELKDAAEEAFRMERNAIEQLDFVEPAVRELHRKWELRLQ